MLIPPSSSSSQTLPHRLRLLRPPPPLHLRQIPPKFECLRFTSAKSALDISISQLTISRAAPGGALIKLALDVVGDTATLVVKLKQMANVTVITTTMNMGFPYSKVDALRGLVPLHAPLQQMFLVGCAGRRGGKMRWREDWRGLGLRCRERKGKYEVDWQLEEVQGSSNGQWRERREQVVVRKVATSVGSLSVLLPLCSSSDHLPSFLPLSLLFSNLSPLSPSQPISIFLIQPHHSSSIHLQRLLHLPLPHSTPRPPLSPSFSLPFSPSSTHLQHFLLLPPHPFSPSPFHQI